MRYVIEAIHDRCGDAEVYIAQAGFSTGGVSMANRARRVTAGNGRVYSTLAGAERAIRRIQAGMGGVGCNWDGWTLRVKECGS